MTELITEEKELLEKEAAYIRKIRKNNTRSDQPAGLAISGGGIRSASFALGALQALGNLELTEKFDYLSTVSGGGYIGSCLTWFMDRIYRAPKQELPHLLGKKGRGARSVNGNDVLGYLRQHGKYLTPGQGLDLVSALGVVLRSMFLGLLVYFPPLAALFYFLVQGCKGLINNGSGCFPPICSLLNAHLGDPGACFSQVFLSLALVLTLLMAVAAVFYSLGTFFSIDAGGKPYRFRILVQKCIGVALKILLLLVVIGTIPMVVALLTSYLGNSAAPIVAGSATSSGYLLAIVKFIMETRTVTGKESKLTGLLIPGAALLLIYGLLMSGYLVARVELNPWLSLVLLLSLAVGMFVNLNYVSLHRMYRDRLMEMFLPDLEAVRTDTWKPAVEANSRKLQSFTISDEEAARKKFPGPFHIINANLIQVDADDAKYRGRGGDNFILTPLFCGSNATGWRDTGNFNSGTMTLATAMAVSGAAASPHAGPSGQGATRGGLVSFLMSFLNISLGYWACNPRRNPGAGCPRPNYFRPGFRRGLLGQGYDERSQFIELSDGGHFENLALYELVRRRVKTIIVTDGGADRDFNFSDLANAVEKVRVDFGVQIDFSDSPAPISDLLPDSGCEKSLYRAKYHLAKRGYAEGKIMYPAVAGKEALEGRIFYIKATLTGGLPEDIYGYKSNNPDFPNQTTADQFFDEGQFEAYRELGYQLTKKMLAETGILQEITTSGPRDCPET